MANYTITPNTKFKSIEIKFEGKPAESVRTILKQNKFRWSPKSKVWYGYTSAEEIAKLLGDSVEIDTSAPKSKGKKAESSPAIPAIASLFDDEPAPADDDTVEYVIRKCDGTFEKRTGKNDLDSGTVIEKIGTEWVATDYLSGMSVCKAKTKKSLMATLEGMTDKLSAVRATEKYKKMCEAVVEAA